MAMRMGSSKSAASALRSCVKKGPTGNARSASKRCARAAPSMESKSALCVAKINA